MGQNYLIDSNVIIDYTAARLPVKGSLFVENVFNTGFQISVVTQIEVLGFNDIPAKLAAVEAFLNTAVVLPLDVITTQQTIQLRRLYKKLKLGDAVIAATALVHDCILLTRNTKDFVQIGGLQTLDLHTLL